MQQAEILAVRIRPCLHCGEVSVNHLHRRITMNKPQRSKLVPFFMALMCVVLGVGVAACSESKDDAKKDNTEQTETTGDETSTDEAKDEESAGEEADSGDAAADEDAEASDDDAEEPAADE